MRLSPVLLGLLGLAGSAAADRTWPSNVDELEEIMFQIKSFRSRKFADTVHPCSSETSGPGRHAAAEWLRSAFHDMSTANTYFKIGGLDASLQYELDNGENTGPGHRTTLTFMGPYVTSRSSLADLLALGVYMSVRSCGGPGGPIVPFRAGRKDAHGPGPMGVPQPQNSPQTLLQQFDRMGFNAEEMIRVTACGHTIGGVHAPEFPELMPPRGVVNGNAPLDSTDTFFDNKVVTEYLSGTTRNPLVVGNSVRIHKNSDFKVYNIDGNKTMSTLADPDTFKNSCQGVLEKMINVVPPGVYLTDPIAPYTVKPVDLQLTLTNGGKSLQFTGYIRVRTTGLGADAIKSVAITYKNRKGSADCGSSSCTFTSTVQGVGKGFDDTFSFYPIEAVIPASQGISSFTVTVNKADGTSKLHDNNGKGYPLQDDVLFQAPQSCISGKSGVLTVVAAVRNDVAGNGAKASIWYKVPQPNSPVPHLENTVVPLRKDTCAGKYTLFSADFHVPGGSPYQSRVDVIAGDKADTFKPVTHIGGTCAAFAGARACGGWKPQEPRDNPTTASSSGSVPSPAANGTVATTSADQPSSTQAGAPTHRATVGGYKYVSCWSEGVGARALSGGVGFANDTMTLEKCAAYCSAYTYWGTEYGRECYCGNSIDKSSAEASVGECNMVCGGDAGEYCGGSNRLALYSTTSAPASATPTATLSHKANVSPYTLVGCWAEGNDARALKQNFTTSDKMTLEACATFCKSYKYFGTEYGSECYCGSYLTGGSKSAPSEECNMACSGDPYQYCGSASRLELYRNPNVTTGNPEQAAAVGDYALVGCQTEGNGTRALGASSLAQDDMTNEVCANWCKDYDYFGTEYGRECYCGNKLDASSAAAPAAECGMLCAGSEAAYCGASNRLSVYKKKKQQQTAASRRGSGGGEAPQGREQRKRW
ncbi:uncharacterized protein UV8b_03071 [Ustilaginoidea virens]|uniref:WSC domain containing protein n=1 Tax=Ustilaginoidea virens TaxID=1159556 RepID=A0A8E5HNP8_USTVR|nr:uncharacterized protein UV8b_03071 [Ustilaginoidea virens]QUC18830.1 hypothetical protein UV8b_03071 [Ustilaginoidea virens]